MYRALVRAKVSVIRLSQPGLSRAEREQIESKYRGYADLAERYTRTSAPALIITHGLSGTGKSTVTQSLVEHVDAIRVRSDVERKRLHGLTAENAAAPNSMPGSTPPMPANAPMRISPDSRAHDSCGRSHRRH